MEIKPIKDFPKYQICSNGNVIALPRTIKGRGGKPVYRKQIILKPRDNGKGYKTVYLYNEIYKRGRGKHLYIHILVAQHFISNPLNLPEVNHEDGNKANNHISNLKWVTRSDNHKHRFRVLGHINQGRPRAVNQIKDGTIIKTWPSILEAATSLKIDNSTITKVCKGKSISCGGFQWEYNYGS